MGVIEELQNLSFDAKATIAVPALVAAVLWAISEARHAKQRGVDQQRIELLDANVLQEQQQERKDARRAIEAELDANLVQLRLLLDDLDKPVGRLDRRPASAEILGAIRLAQMSPIRWQRSVWEDRAVQSISALSPDEMSVVSAIYDRLNRLDVLKGAIGGPWYTMAGNWNLYDDGRRAWDDFQVIANQLIEGGNPLIQFGTPPATG